MMMTSSPQIQIKLYKLFHNENGQNFMNIFMKFYYDSIVDACSTLKTAPPPPPTHH